MKFNDTYFKTKQEKIGYYLKRYRVGDIILTAGTNAMARTIRWFDRNKWEEHYFNHCGIVLQVGQRPVMLESLSKGADLNFLKDRIEENFDFAILRPLIGCGSYTNISLVRSVAERLSNDISDGKFSGKYDYFLLPKIGAARLMDKAGIDKPWFVSDNKGDRDICSEVARRYTDMLGIKEFTAEEMKRRTGREWLVPQDFARYGHSCFDYFV